MTRNPLDGPFMSARELTDYADEPGFAIAPAAPIVPRYFGEALTEVRVHWPDLDPAASHRKAWGIAQDYDQPGRSRSMGSYVAWAADFERAGF